MSAPAEDSVFDRYRERVDRPLYRLFVTYGLARIRWFGLGMVANVFARGASLLPPLVLGIAIDAVFTGDAPYRLPLVPEAWLPRTDPAQFWVSAALIAGAFVATAVFTWVYGVAANNFAHRVMHAVRTDSFARMQRLDMPFFDDKQTGEIMSVLNNDASNLERFLDDALHDSARLGVMVLGIAVILFYENAQLALVTLVVVPAMVGFTWWFMRTVEPRYVAQRSAVGFLNTRLENALSGVELVKTAGTEDYETNRVGEASLEYFRKTMAMLRLNYVYRPGMELLAGVAFLVTFVVGGLWLFSGPPLFFTGTLTPGTFVTFLLLTQRFVTPLAEISNIVSQYENAKASSERVFGLMDIPVRVDDRPDAVDLTDVDGHVEYEDVDFAYTDAIEALEDEAGEREKTATEPTAGRRASEAGTPDDSRAGDAVASPSPVGNADAEDPVLRNVTFSAEPGETIAVVGPTGAGKSTLLKLLLRLYEVDDGAVRVDGHDVRDVTLSSLRGAIGYVGQDTVLFDGTVGENIRYGRFDADDAAVRAAARAAEAHTFIEDLSDGYDTRIGERGVKLSGGQRQRLSIARTVLRDPPILVLDEATSAVDTETELLIQRSLDRLAADRTTFVIAHRLSTVKDADAILVLDDGEIVERGTHEELLAAGGLYANLWGVQAGEIEQLPETFLERAREATSAATVRYED